jgi:hypothetical protein
MTSTIPPLASPRAYQRWFHRSLGRLFVQALAVIMTVQGFPLAELGRYYHWTPPLWAVEWVGQRQALAAGNAGRITNISPSCAAIGEQVSISGNGLGGPNVVIRVGGVQAQVVTATGNRATFVVPLTAPRGVTTVTATNPGGQNGSIVFRVQTAEVCDNGVDEDCSGVPDDPSSCG